MTPAARRLMVAAAATPSIAAVAVVALILTAFAAFAAGGGTGDDPAIHAAACNSVGSPASGLSAEQTMNAATIASVAAARGLGTAGAVIGVMTAMTESSLLNIDHGDEAGPDSRGLFQQRDSWGPASVRMDPAGAADLFFDRLETIDGWQDLAPWAAAQQVQHSAFADGSNYAAHYQDALTIVAGLQGIDPEVTGAQPASAVADVPGFDVVAFCAMGSTGVAAGGGVMAGAWGGFSNGQIPATALCPLTAAGQLLRCDAAAAWNGMSTAYRASSGSPLCITDSYRTLAAQIALHAEKPTLAAAPGTSNHGWALAVDLCEPGRGGMGFTTATYLWLKANAGGFGFTHPAWAEPGRGQEEPWHWEYTRGAS
ncbi:MAG: M15 family metallopeptidase [Actinobacteria bacterium]|nr:M15 family metallopeptidase [Actinomycetota bacterium]